MPSISQVLVEAIIAVGIIFVSLRLWTLAVRSWQARSSLIPAPPRVVPWGLVDLLIAIGIWVFGFVIAALASKSLYTNPSGEPLEKLTPSAQIPLLWISGVTMLCVCLAIAGALFLRHRVTWADLGWDSAYFARDILRGLKAFVMLAPIVYGIQLVVTQVVESKHPLIEMLKENPDSGFFIVAGFAAVIVAPIAEEFLFRVVLQGWLERVFRVTEPPEKVLFGGRHEEPPAVVVAEIVPTESHAPDNLSSPTAAITTTYISLPQANAKTDLSQATQNDQGRVAPILISAAFFAFSHWDHGPDPIPLFVFALGLGYLYQSTHRILPCIVLHFMLNACSLAALWMSIS